MKGLDLVPAASGPLTRKDFVPGTEVRWCPGCGDYAVLATFQGLLPTLGIKKENFVIVSGIGCSSRFPYYVDTYGMHAIHGRPAAIATGVALAREDLAVLVVTGDGDALSIGGNHLIHALRRNVNITIILFNNRIYGLTKGQASPTSERGKITKSTPFGLVDEPFNAVSLALGAGATFVARTIDSQRAHLTEVLKAAIEHRGAALVEIFQNCQIFNDGAFDALKGPDAELIPLVDGQPVVFGKDNSLSVVRNAQGVLEVATAGTPVVHDKTNAGLAFELSQLTDAGVITRAPIGIFRDVEKPTSDDLARAQLSWPEDRVAALQELITGKDTWTIE
ncbi:MAG: 2-oxoacid:ferredoxin oxidoreductase subunit beta [Propionibacteriaceae bacterium]|jgi:2-oxoglutarate ferredoxin oxidoreductase subunit beta|nr:2-oxoacid:ferredoxin oxidoreductase subunit beta [Propionibacteriaceae bacterium]